MNVVMGFLLEIIIPIAAGRLCLGKQAEIIVKPPFSRPEPPRPAIARATINILED